MNQKKNENSDPLPPIPSEESVIWRYRNLPQLISILERESLWFSRADILPDSFEGSHSRKTVKKREQRLRDSGTSEEYVEQLAQDLSRTYYLNKRRSYLNCWHLNPRESVAMWNEYSTEGQGIAIKSTVGALKKAIEEQERYYLKQEKAPDSEAPPRMFIAGKVQYIDYNREETPPGNIYYPLFYKRESYKYEQEFRVMTVNQESPPFDLAPEYGIKMDEYHLPPGKVITPNFEKIFEKLNGESNPSNSIEFIQLIVNQLEIQGEELPRGKYIDLDINNFVEEIYVSPSAEKWFFELTKDVVKNYKELDSSGIKINPSQVVQSSLDEEPVY